MIDFLFAHKILINDEQKIPTNNKNLPKSIRYLANEIMVEKEEEEEEEEGTRLGGLSRFNDDVGVVMAARRWCHVSHASLGTS